ncbi:MAG: KUP/HAK/KT family potassium transporter [Bacteroidales bacterium]|nr:KUP/HAK/KT family potassium transporter [Bacteroidales bacterium]
MKSSNIIGNKAVSLTGLIITLGIVFGDLGTSPLYVMQAIVQGSGGNIDADFMLGVVSCLIWTLTLQTTVKYVLITMRADNHGEGGILALYALVRKKKRKLYILAIIGASALLADGVITPSITVVSAVEGLQLNFPKLHVIPLALSIIALLFLIQKFGTASIGKSFGPIMLIWFVTLAGLGLPYVIQMPMILRAFNPVYAIKLLFLHPGGFALLGAVFLVTTGAEALYSDLGHCGYRNIRISWLFVKVTLIINYMGQAAWILMQKVPSDSLPNPFFAIMPHWFLPFGVVISTAAAVIASQALISGSFTIISEAVSLNFWPKLRINYPTTNKGQMYISSVNWMLFVACVLVILMFRNSSNMQAAYGLSITITMLMTTLLMLFYLKRRHLSKILLVAFTGTYLFIEGSFLAANMLKFSHGGWFTGLLDRIISYAMYMWFQARRIKNRFTRFVHIKDYYEQLKDLSRDKEIPKYSTHLVYLTRADKIADVEAKIMYSVFSKSPKRADTYWLLHVHICDDPHTLEYSVDHLIPGVLIRVEFRVGFKVQPRINLFFSEVLRNMVENDEVNMLSNYPSLRKHNVAADFRYIIIHRVQNYDFDFPGNEQFIMDNYRFISLLALSDVKAYGLDSGNVLTEVVPLVNTDISKPLMKRVDGDKNIGKESSGII